MAPKWLPICKAMQRHCEPYFCAIERWRMYEDELLLLNRLQMIETVCKLFDEFGPKSLTYHFDLMTEYEDVELEIEVIPSAGKNFKVGGDSVAFEAARSIVPLNLFVKVGLHFQSRLLLALGGFAEKVLKEANLLTRKSLIACVEKLFRLPEKAGKARFVYYCVNEHNDTWGSSPSTVPGEDGMYRPANNMLIDYPTEMLHTAPSAKKFYEFLLQDRKERRSQEDHREDDAHVKDDYRSSGQNESKKEKVPSRSTKTSTSSRSKKTIKKTITTTITTTSIEREEEEWDDEGIKWSCNHESVGQKVAASFVVSRKEKTFKGEVMKYAGPSAPGEEDQLYHIEWEDGDDQDYDEGELQEGLRLHQQVYGKGRGSEKVWQSNGKSGSRRSSNSSSNRSSSRNSYNDDIEDEEEEDEVIAHYSLLTVQQEEEQEWTVNNDAIGVEVLAYFQAKNSSDLTRYVGKVQKFLPASDPTAKDQLYHIMWEDGDEQDYGEEELQQGIKLMQESRSSTDPSPSGPVAKVVPKRKRPAARDVRHALLEGRIKVNGAVSQNERKDVNEEEEVEWIDDHSSIGVQVAHYFDLPTTSKKGKAKRKKSQAYVGTVTKYAPPSEPLEEDQLYHVVWEDGDEQDFDEREYTEGQRIFKIVRPKAEAVVRVQPSRETAATATTSASLSSSAEEGEGEGEESQLKKAKTGGEDMVTVNDSSSSSSSTEEGEEEGGGGDGEDGEESQLKEAKTGGEDMVTVDDSSSSSSSTKEGEGEGEESQLKESKTGGEDMVTVHEEATEGNEGSTAFIENELEATATELESEPDDKVNAALKLMVAEQAVKAAMVSAVPTKQVDLIEIGLGDVMRKNEGGDEEDDEQNVVIVL